MVDSDTSEPGTERRIFSAGLKRKRIEFVSAGRPSTASAPTVGPRLSLSEQYLSITLKNGASSASETENAAASKMRESHGVDTKSRLEEGAICRICQGPTDARAAKATITSLRHEASLAHQICLEHSQPPSHLDRKRHGLRYLLSYGWEPDSQLGLGASGTGIRAPIKAKAKHDTVGLGAKVPEWDRKAGKGVEKLDAKGVRNKEERERIERERLQQLFYANNDINRYLGVG